MKKTRFFGILLPILALPMVLTSCGGGGSNNTSMPEVDEFPMGENMTYEQFQSEKTVIGHNASSIFETTPRKVTAEFETSMIAKEGETSETINAGFDAGYDLDKVEGYITLKMNGASSVCSTYYDAGTLHNIVNGEEKTAVLTIEEARVAMRDDLIVKACLYQLSFGAGDLLEEFDKMVTMWETKANLPEDLTSTVNRHLGKINDTDYHLILKANGSQPETADPRSTIISNYDIKVKDKICVGIDTYVNETAKGAGVNQSVEVTNHGIASLTYTKKA